MHASTRQTDNSLFPLACQCLMITDPAQKGRAVERLRQRWLAGALQRRPAPVVAVPVPGRPERPRLVDPRAVPRRNLNTDQGRACFVHAIAHIEFNAINLALDAVYRFQDMPDDYYSDWLQVAQEEALHFSLLRDYLRRQGFDYGDFDAHNGLWEMALKTDFDVMVRMALVPRVLEARGLDVTPGMIRKLRQQSQTELVTILQRIFDDEIGHVRIGTRWFRHCCAQRALQPDATFDALLDRYMQGSRFGPFDLQARRSAGFSEREIQDLIARHAQDKRDRAERQRL